MPWSSAARYRAAWAEIVADPQFSEAHIARIHRIYRVALPLYAVMTLATALSRLPSDRVMGALWLLQCVVASATLVAIWRRPRRAHRVMQVGFVCLFLGMLMRIPRAVWHSGLQDVDLHALSVGIVLALLVGQTVFAPDAGRRVNLACALLASAIAVISFAVLPRPSAAQLWPVLRLLAGTAIMVALLGFVTATVHEYGRLWEEHRLMQTLALCDPLTELPNRRACEATLKREIVRAEREQQVLSVIMVDVDHFKQINDRFGHHVGDRTLIEIAQLLRRSVRGSDEPARWAGDEFVVVLPGTSLDGAQAVATRIRTAVAAANIGATSATVTLGVAQFVLGEDDREALLSRADRNLYQAKRNGRDCVVAL
jgi:diguanylate cyclase (GGDEF)-like protein